VSKAAGEPGRALVAAIVGVDGPGPLMELWVKLLVVELVDSLRL
jgi:hypothetical protein